MKKLSKLLVTTFLAATTTFSFLGCGGEKTEDKSNNNTSATNETDISGTVRYLIHPQHEDHTKLLVEEFNKVYPNITIELELIQSDVSTDLTTLAASKNLPDVVIGYGTDILYAVSQGWAEPIDSYLKDDEDYKYVPESAKTNKVDGNTYGVPYNASTTGIIVNLDLLESLNLDVPDYDWTIDEFLNLAKSATTDKYSGIDNIPYFYEFMVGSFSKSLTHWGYSLDKNKFDFNDGGFLGLTNFVRDIKQIPGLIANNLINNETREAGKEDDYQKKFGKDVDAFMDGKVLFGNYGMWNLDYFEPNFNYDFYPYPTAEGVGYRQGVGIDQPFMTVAAQDKDAAFQWLKWITYSPEGIKANYEVRKQEENPVPRVLMPTTTNPEIIELYNNLEEVPDGIKYIFNNLDKSFCKESGDIPVPGFGGIVSEILQPKFKEITDGKVDGASIAAELETMANDNLEENRKNLYDAIEVNE